MSRKQRILQRKEKATNYQAVKRIKIVAGEGRGTIFLGVDLQGNRVDGKSGDKLNVEQDITRDSATALLISNFAVPADESAKAEKYIPEPKKLKLRVEAEPISMIQIVSAGLRSSETAFFLGNSDGVGLTGKVGDWFSISKGEITEELARHLIKKKFAKEMKKPLVRKVIDTVKKVL